MLQPPAVFAEDFGMGRLNVLITVDTEVYPRSTDPGCSVFEQEFQRDVYGATPSGRFGIHHQMDVLNAHGLKGVFFVEVLFGYVHGFDYLQRMVSDIRDRGHDVQLHIHPSWLKRTDAILPGKRGHLMRLLSLDDQTTLIGLATDRLQSAGAPNVCAFRAGDYGANGDTLRALANNGLRFDTSHNVCAKDGYCGLAAADPLHQPRRWHGVYEFPVATFEDYPRHRRCAQLTACSSGEMESALLNAWRKGWYAFVIVSHSFELIKRSPRPDAAARPDRIAIRRFDRLCRFLSHHADRFETVTFSDLNPDEIPDLGSAGPLRSNIWRTGRRIVEQAARRWM